MTTRHSYSIGALVYLRLPGTEPCSGRFVDGTPRRCRVLEHLGTDDRTGEPSYLVQDGTVSGYEVEATEGELVAT